MGTAMTPALAPVRPWVFMVLVVPFGRATGFPTVALAYQPGAADVGSGAIAALPAQSHPPHTRKFASAPVVDLPRSRRGRYLAASVATAAGLVDACPIDQGIVFNQIDGAFEAWLFDRGATAAACIETPGQRPCAQRVAAQAAAMRAFVCV
jgi:hypothetical protein